MPLWILNIFGYLLSNWRKVAIVVVAAVLLSLLSLGGRWCFKKTPPKLNEAEIFEAQKAIAENDRKVMEKVLVESDARDAEINATAANATTDKVNAIAESKKRWANASEEEMAKELEARK